MKKVHLPAALFAILLFSSCYGTKILYGDVEPNEPLVEVNKTWNHHVIFGLAPVGNNKIKTAEYMKGLETENFVVKTNQSFVDGLLSAITFGIYTPTQTKFYIPAKEMGQRK